MKYHRRVIRICAEDSPNVKRGLAQRRAGKQPDYLEVVPGVLSLAEYDHRRATWDKMRQCIGLDAQFWKGGELFLYPADRLAVAVETGRRLAKGRTAKGIGVDAAEGGDNTVMAAVDELGLIAMEATKTPYTSVIPGMVIAFGMKHNCPAQKWFFDRGGGGQQHADRLRDMGYGVQTVAFGEAVSLEPKRGMRFFEEKVDVREEKYVYKNRRAQMYHRLSLLIDPESNQQGFGIPGEYAELLRQMSLIPKLFRIPGTDKDWSMYDGEGRIQMLPKNKRDAETPCLSDLVGHSPDELDALVVAVYAMEHKVLRPTAGSAV